MTREPKWPEEAHTLVEADRRGDLEFTAIDCERCIHPLAEHYANGCGWCICKAAGPAEETDA